MVQEPHVESELLIVHGADLFIGIAILRIPLECRCFFTQPKAPLSLGWSSRLGMKVAPSRASTCRRVIRPAKKSASILPQPAPGGNQNIPPGGRSPPRWIPG